MKYFIIRLFLAITEALPVLSYVGLSLLSLPPIGTLPTIFRLFLVRGIGWEGKGRGGEKIEWILLILHVIYYISL